MTSKVNVPQRRPNHERKLSQEAEAAALATLTKVDDTVASPDPLGRQPFRDVVGATSMPAPPASTAKVRSKAFERRDPFQSV